MSTTDTRAAFKEWHIDKFGWFDDSLWPTDENRYASELIDGRWAAYQAATEAAKATGTAGEIDADAEMAKVKRDVELMGVGFLVDGKRCSLDRITWFNRPGDTWLPPPPGYQSEAARQPAPVAQPADTARSAAMRVEAVLATYDDCIRVISEMRLPHGQAASRNYYNTALFNAMEQLTKTRDGYRAATNRSQP